MQKENQEEKVIEEGEFGYYTIKAKEGYYRLEKKLGLTKEQLVMLNPELIDQGLKLGMVLKIPKASIQNIVMESFPVINLADSLVDFSPKKVALLLPFKTKSIDSINDIYLSDPKISSTGKMIRRWYFDPRSKKYYMKKGEF